MEQGSFSLSVVRFSVLTGVLAQCIRQPGTDARSFFLWGLPMALALCGVLRILCRAQKADAVFAGQELRSRLVCGGIMLLFGGELVAAAEQAQRLCWEQFSSMAVLGLLPLLLWAGWRLQPEVFCRCVRFLWWAAAAAGLLCILGLRGQLHWENLMEPAQSTLPSLPLFAEYAALPYLCPKTQARRGAWLPLLAFGLAAAYRLGMELVFGPASAVPGAELLRAGILGGISRFDAAILLVWLAAALFRLCFLVQVLHGLGRRTAGQIAQEKSA